MNQLLPLFAILVSTLCFGQSPYTFSSYTEDYSELINATPIEVYDFDDDTWDDPNFTVPFGFDFEIGGHTFSQVKQIGSGAILNFIDLTAQETQFIGLFNDIADGSMLDGADPSEISYQIDGAANGRIVKIQYKNAAFADQINGNNDEDPSASDRINFQVWFYETSNSMEIHFGSSQLPDPESAFFGNQGPTIALATGLTPASSTFDYAVIITGDPENPTPTEIDALNEATTPLTGMPSSGRVYRFDLTSTGIEDIQNTLFTISPSVTHSTLSLSGKTPPNATFHIFDITGKEIKTGSLQNKETLDVSALHPGLYLFAVDEMAQTMKFIKQ